MPVLLGRPRVHLRELDSTNRLARDLAARGAPHGTLVTASAQTAGRGRQGRVWSTPPGEALLCSLLLRDPPPLLSLAAGVAVAEVCGPQARLKWPNDVLLGGGLKVAGILVEGRPQEHWAVLGIGLNVALDPAELPDELRARAGSLGRDRDAVEPTLAALLTALATWLAAPQTQVLAAIRARDALYGRTVSWERGHSTAAGTPDSATGTAAGIDAQGRLLVTLPDGSTTALDAGEVHLSRR